MVHVLTHMAAGMLKKLEGLMDARYGGLFSMTDEELDASETHLIPATSDAIERYFGLASWLEQQNPNLTRQNHSYRLSMKETKVGSKLVAMYLESEASRGRGSRMLYPHALVSGGVRAADAGPQEAGVSRPHHRVRAGAAEEAREGRDERRGAGEDAGRGAAVGAPGDVASLGAAECVQHDLDAPRGCADDHQPSGADARADAGE